MERANEAFKAEVSQLKFEIATLSKSNAEADEKISEANIKVADLESQLTSAKEVGGICYSSSYLVPRSVYSFLFCFL